MVLALNSIYNEGSYHLYLENHRDRYYLEIPPTRTATFVGKRWIDKGKGRTVLTVRSGGDHAEGSSNGAAGSFKSVAAVISLEDISWNLVITGDVANGNHSVPVDGNKDFDLVVRKDGKIAVRCLGGSFTEGRIEEIVSIPPLESMYASTLLSPRPASQEAAVCQSTATTAQQLDSSFSSSTASSHPPQPPNDISPDLAMLLNELRADQRRILQREFQLVGATYAERLLNGGRALFGVVEPVENLPLTAVINLLVIPFIFLLSYMYNIRRSRPPSSSGGRRRGYRSRGRARAESIRRAGEELYTSWMRAPPEEEGPPPYPGAPPPSQGEEGAEGGGEGESVSMRELAPMGR